MHLSTRLKSQKGFTLIETLIVIAIILTVAAIVFPSYTQARKSAKVTATITNLRQIHLAALLYQADNGGGGTYGSLAVMGLPSPYDMINDATIHRLYKSPCGRHPSYSTETATVYFPGLHPDEFPFEAEMFKENLITVFDMMCSDPDIDVDNEEHKKVGIGILLSGQLVRHNKIGWYSDAIWWADPQP